MAIQLFGDPFNLQGNNQNIQGGNSTDILQPATAPVQVATPATPTIAPVKTVTPAPVKKVAPVVAQPVATKPSVYFYKPDPNSQQVYDANGTPLSYDQYIAAGGLPNFSNVLNQQIPNQRPASPVVTEAPATPVAPAPTIDPNQALAEAAGKAGIGLDDLMKILNPSSGISADEENQIRKKFGIDTLEQQVFTAPSKTTEQLYTDAYTSAGLSDLKTKIADLNNQIAQKKQQFTDAEGVINENPFLSEASRVGRVKRLREQAEATISNLIDEQNQYANLYNTGLGEVQNLITRYTTDFNANQDFNQKKLNYLEQKAKEQIEQKQSENSSANLSSLTAYLEAKARATKPDTIGSPETGYFKYDPDTGKFIQITEATGPKATGIVAEYQYYADQERAAGRTPVDFNTYQNQDANRKRSVTNVYAGGGDYSSKQLADLTTFNENISKNATYAKTSSMRNYADNVIVALNAENGLSDIAAINQFQKVIDEGAVTRDQDVKLIQDANSLVGKLKQQIKKLEKGDQLSPEQRSQMKSLIESLYAAQVKALNNDPYIKAKKNEAGLKGFKPEDTILGELGGFQAASNTSQATNANLDDLF